MTATGQGRIAQIDVLRGFAVLGVYWIGVGAFGLPYAANALPTLLGTPSDLNLSIWAFTEVYMEGAMRGVFSMLFGASALIFLDQARLGAGGIALVDRFYRRNLTLMLFGIVHAYFLLWPHDVLYAYGLLGMFIFPLRQVPALALFLVGIAMQAVADIEVDWGLVLGWLRGLPAVSATGPEPALAATPQEGARFLNWLRMQMLQDIQTYRSGYLDIFAAQVGEVAAQQSTHFYRRHLFEIGGMMLIGMALYRWGVLSGRRGTLFYLGLVGLGFGLGGWLRGEGIYLAWTQGFDPLALARLEEGDLDLGRLPVALGYVGLVGLLSKWGRAAPLTRALAATGRLALTNYIAQTAFSIVLFYGLGFGLFATLERWQLALICLGVCVLQVTLSVAWLRRFRYGPLEWLWRSLIQGRRQAIWPDSAGGPRPGD
jgi:uncharacterized protein